MIRGLGKLPTAARGNLIYLVAGRPADCGQLCIDYHSTIEVLVAEFGLRQQVLLLSEYVSEVSFSTLRTHSTCSMLLMMQAAMPLQFPAFC